ncbi:MAG: Calx-beta protein [Phycisphaerales bacterium]|nr:Calx-beta protein [Phycisphaerales bacterium]
MNKPKPYSPFRGACVESLETRQLLAFTFQFDYRYDNTGFFTQARKDVLTAAGQLLSTRIGDAFSAVTPSGTNTFTVNLRNPSTGDTTSIVNPAVPTDTVIVYVGARDLDGSTLGQGGPNGWSASGTTAWTTLVRGRGQSGATATPRTDFAPKTGSIAFDNATNWFFGITTAGLGTTQSDFYSVAAHELGHVLGIGAGSETWPAYASGGYFNGPASVAAYGSKVPLMADGVHFKEGIQSGGQEVALDPTLTRGTRKLYTPLDYAALDDVGYEIKPAATIAGSVFTDLDNDGYRDSNETGIAGVSVYIDKNSNNVLDAGENTVITDANGRYTFTNLATGTYRVAEKVPATYVAIKPSTGYRTISVTAGQFKASQDFAIAKDKTPGKVSGTVFDDLDGDGFRDSNEPLLVGWRVFADTNKDGVVSAGETVATTNNFGGYSLSLPPGDYRIAAETKGGYRRSGPASGYYDVTLAAGGAVSSKAFGFTAKTLLTGKVFKDIDGDGLLDTNEFGLGNWRVYIDTNKNGLWDSTESSVLTDGSGNWTIKDQNAGTVLVRVVQQTKYVLKSPASKYYSVSLAAAGTKSMLNFAEQPTV